MKQVLWFRRDLRLHDTAILAHARGEVLPIFIFDSNILQHLKKDDKRISYIYHAVLKLKKELQKQGLDLAIFHTSPLEVFKKLQQQGYTEVLCSTDFDAYALQRDKEVEKLLPLKRFNDAFLLHPKDALKADGTAYKVFTPFYKSLEWLWSAQSIPTLQPSKELVLSTFDYSVIPTLKDLGFQKAPLPAFLEQDAHKHLNSFLQKLEHYPRERDFFAKDATSNLAVFLRFGTLSIKEVFNTISPLRTQASQAFIRQLFWREFFNILLYHFPHSATQNFDNTHVTWQNDEQAFQKWCKGLTGVPIVDAAMQHLNKTGLMHNRLRMIVASFLCKNLLIDWRWGEAYFAKHLLDYEASSNIGSWQWAAGTGADAAPYFRVFNPYTQSQKFDKEAVFIKEVLPSLKDIEAKNLHKENALVNNLFLDYPRALVDIKTSRKRAIEVFKKAKYANA